MQEPKVDCVVALEVRCRLRGGMECTDVAPRLDNCLETFFYSVEICNVGSVEMMINAVDFNFNDNVNSIVAAVPQNQLLTGQCTSLVPNLQVDVCSAGSHLAVVTAEATPPNGNMCQDQQQQLVSVASLPPP